MIEADDLRAVPAFEGLSGDDLQWLADHAEDVRLEQGGRPFVRGEPALHMLVVLEGAFRVFTVKEGQRRLFDTFEAGRVTGVLPYSRMTHWVGEGFAVGPSRFATIHRDHFAEMLYRMPELGQRLVGIMSDRVRESTRGDQQREKLMALGKLSAGLAHELNNPAAAVRRTVGEMQGRLAEMPKLVACLAQHGLSEAAVREVGRLQQEALGRPVERLSVMQRSEREDELADWIEDRGMDSAWRMAETFVEAGMKADDLDRIAEGLPEQAVPAVLAWVEGSLAAHAMLGEIAAASGRISELVQSVKSYSHMDQAPARQPTDVREGLDSTLTMLGYKFKRKSIHLEKDYADDLPTIEAFGGELNQVWTNLIVNAIDAVEEKGTIRIGARAEPEMETVAVEVADDGSGIPEEIQGRIFEPFFTTKDVGEGTGLGLDIAGRIVRQHGGEITVESEPGRTSFTVRLPVRLSEAQRQRVIEEELAEADEL